MKYITGIHALNLPCKLDTCGDWHQSGIQWNIPQIRESKGSLFGDYGIELNHTIPERDGRFAVANTLRALLDLLYEGNYSVAEGANKDFICNQKYDKEFFDHVLMMKDLDNWDEIDQFMGNEYMMKWIRYKEKYNLHTPVIINNKGTLLASDQDIDDINSFTRLKAVSFSNSSSIRDLYELTYIINNRFDELNPYVIEMLRDVISFKGLEYFEYITHTQKDELIDNDLLAEDFLKAYDRIGVLHEKSEMEKAERNSRYIAKIDKAFEQLYSGKGEVHELVED